MVNILNNNLYQTNQVAIQAEKDCLNLDLFGVLDGISDAIVVTLGYATYLIVLTTAKAVEIFRDMKTAAELREHADFIHAVYVIHRKGNLSERVYSIDHPHLPRLVMCRNIASVEALTGRQERKKAAEFFDAEDCELIKTLNSYNKIDKKGICIGISLAVIRDCLKNSDITKAELIRTVKKLEKGGTAEAAAIHKSFNITYDNNIDVNNITKKKLENEKVRLQANLAVLKTRKDDESAKLIAEIEQLLKAFDLKLSELTSKAETHKSTFKIIAEKLSLKMNRFEKVSVDSLKDLPPKTYQILDSENSHSIVLHKGKTDSFILDPNLGLIPCDKMDPMKTVKSILALYSDDTDNCFLVDYEGS